MIPLATHVCATGRVLDLYDPGWGCDEAPLVYSHVFTILPGMAKGWGRHETHDDRYALLAGTIEIALYDARASSPTHGCDCRIIVSEQSRRLVIIPRGVWHAARNIGTGEALIADFPTSPYNHEWPDKFSLPLGTHELPVALGPDRVGY